VTGSRRWYWRWGRCLTAMAWVLAAAVACCWLRPEAASAADPDPDLEAVQAVCGRCHTIAVFLNKPRSWNRWNDVFADMTQRGANGTDDQLVGVTRYFLRNLTYVNLNTSPAEELTGVLGIGDDVAQDIIARRQRRRFENIAQLRAVPGVDAAIVEQRKGRILF